MPSSVSDYLRTTRAPRYSLTFALPLLLLYEVLAFSLSGPNVAGVRNGADVLLKSLFLSTRWPERTNRLRCAPGGSWRVARLA